MSTKIVKSRILLRSDLKVGNASAIPKTGWDNNSTKVLAQGEVGVEIDTSVGGKSTRRIKIGDGSSTWAQLPYVDGGKFEIKTTSPTSSDTGHEPGTLWINTNIEKIYTCLASGVWVEIPTMNNIASTTVPGLVKVGDNLDITVDGQLNATALSQPAYSNKVHLVGWQATGTDADAKYGKYRFVKSFGDGVNYIDINYTAEVIKAIGEEQYIQAPCTIIKDQVGKRILVYTDEENLQGYLILTSGGEGDSQQSGHEIFTGTGVDSLQGRTGLRFSDGLKAVDNASPAETRVSIDMTTTGSGNAVTDLGIVGGKLRATKDITFLTEVKMLNTDNTEYMDPEPEEDISGSGTINLHKISKTGSASDINSGTLAAERLPTVPINKGGTGATDAATARANLGLSRGVANGVAELDANGKVPLSQINDSIIGQVEYKGTWNASTNSPTLPTTPTEKGLYYIVSVAGTRFGHTFEVGDWIISNGAAWDKVDNTDAVSSVAGRTGNVVLTKADVGLNNLTNIPDSEREVLSATKLKTARTIGGVSFDGTANINLPGVNIAGNQNTTGSAAKLTTPVSLKVALGSTGAVTFDGSATVDNIPVTGTLNVANGGTGATTFTAGALLIGDGINAVKTRSITNNTTGTAIVASTNIPTMNTLHYALPTINSKKDYTSNTTLYAPTGAGSTNQVLVSSGVGTAPNWKSPTEIIVGKASQLETPRTIAIAGDATGSASFSGAANVSISATLADSGVTIGTYKSVTVDAKGRVTGGTNPTTLAGYGITNAELTNNTILITTDNVVVFDGGTASSTW